MKQLTQEQQEAQRKAHLISASRAKLMLESLANISTPPETELATDSMLNLFKAINHSGELEII